jgi:hypothetical protein
MTNGIVWAIKDLVPRQTDCTEMDPTPVEILDERPLACANTIGATEENGVFFKIDAAMCNRAVLQLGNTHPCHAGQSLAATGSGA